MFRYRNFKNIGYNNSETPAVYSYETTEDTIAQVSVSGYFSDQRADIREGDLIVARCTDGSTTLTALNSDSVVAMPSAREVVRVVDNANIGIWADTPSQQTITFIGDSTTAGSSGTSRINGYMMACGDKVSALVGYNQGVGGYKIQDALDNIATIGAAIKTIVDIQIGINDISQETETASSYIAKLKNLISKCFDYGAKRVIVHTITKPFNGGSSISLPHSTAQIQLRIDMNNEIKAINMPNVYIESVASENTTEEDFIDGVHYSMSGSIRIGKLQGATAAFYSSGSRFQSYLSSNLLTNQSLSGTGGSLAGGGSPSGSVATSWTVASPVLTGVVCSKTLNAISDGYESQTITVPTQTLGSDSIIAFRQDIIVPSTLITDVYYSLGRFKLEAGSSGVQNIESKASNSFESESEAATPPAIITGKEYTGVLASVVKVAISAGVTTIQLQFNIRFKAGTCSAVIHWDKPVFRKIS